MEQPKCDAVSETVAWTVGQCSTVAFSAVYMSSDTKFDATIGRNNTA